MKKYLPYCSLSVMAFYFLYCLISAIAGFDGAVFILMMIVAAVPLLIGEIIGRIIAIKKKKPYADRIAVYIVALLSAAWVSVIIIQDLNSTGFMAGIAGFILLISAVPLLGLVLVINTVMLVRRYKKKNADQYRKP